MATVRYTTSETSYTALTAGECVVEVAEKGSVRVHVGTTLPIAGTTAYHNITYPDGIFAYHGTETVYVRAESDLEPDVVATHII